MDYREKMVVVPQIKTEDDDDEDLDALRMAALQSLRLKDTTHNKQSTQLQKILPKVTQPSRFSLKNQRSGGRRFFHRIQQQKQQKLNGNFYYQSPRNPNLIAIVPVDEPCQLQQIGLVHPVKVKKAESCEESYSGEISKFHRFKDNGSASEEEDTKEHQNIVTIVETETLIKEELEKPLTEIASQEEATENLQKNGENQEEDGNDDDDDILIMADLEEEDSLERLMDEMEKEMNVDKPERRDKRSNKDETKHSTKRDEGNKNLDQRSKSDENFVKKDTTASSVISEIRNVRNEKRSVSPYVSNRINQRRKSLSPKLRLRKKSPRRSPRRSPIRQSKKSPREPTRCRSPRKSPSRYSPRSRSPKLSPRRSPNRIKRSPLKKLSPRGRSPKCVSSHSRSPRSQRSRSPRRLSRSKSPRTRTPNKVSRSRSPRLSRSRSPRFSPLRLSPLKSPGLSPRRVSPRRLHSRSRSPCLSPPRRGSSNLRSPKVSPRRISPRLRSPMQSSPLRRSPWSSPRHSPRLSSPRRRRSTEWSPKELSKKHGLRSTTPDSLTNFMYTRESSPTFKSNTTSEIFRTKAKSRDETYERPTEITKESVDTISDPVLEARRKKFESTRPIDPINANKKIKLYKKHTVTKEPLEKTENQLSSIRKINKTIEEYDIQETDLSLEMDYEFEELETAENTCPSVVTSSTNTCIDVELQKRDKEKSLKKKKKRDKEPYVLGKLKNDLPLSERIGKDKKSKKRKDIISDGSREDVETIFEDIAIDEEGDLRMELSRRRAERLNRTVPIQSARLVQSAFKGVVNEVVKNNAKANQRHLVNTEEKSNQKEVRRVTVLHRSLTELHDSEDESTLDSKVPVRFRLGLNKQVQESRESKVTRKTSKRQSRKVKHKNHLSLKDVERIL